MNARWTTMAFADSTRSVLGLLLAIGCASCGAPNGSHFGADAGDASLELDAPDPGLPDATVEAAPPCVGLKCQQVTCSSGRTRVSGTVWDPAGKNPLYGAIVYVPNGPLAPIPHGPKCDSCGGADVSGSPITTALTDPSGHFVLDDAPVGADIPLVVQLGKWRRKIVLPKVSACVDNPIVDTPSSRVLALPKNQGEGDMPRIALTAGCDPIHTLIEKIGIDANEFTNGAGGGAVQVYAGEWGQNANVSNATDAYAFYGNKSELFRYDILINECECAPFPRDRIGDGYANVAAFLAAGGRVFSSHYHLNFFGEQGKADPSLQSAAAWTLWNGSFPFSEPYLIDTTFPKGKALDEWLHGLANTSVWSNVVTSPKGQITTSNSGDIGPPNPGISQRWIYPKIGSSTVYLSINTPTNVPADQRCGRAVATDIHVGNGSLTTMTEQEAALEFMFFDLAACVIDDGKPPVPPEPK